MKAWRTRGPVYFLAAVLVALAALGLKALADGEGGTPAASAPKWQYKVAWVQGAVVRNPNSADQEEAAQDAGERIQKALDDYGAQGWECFNAPIDPATGYVFLYLRKPGG